MNKFWQDVTCTSNYFKIFKLKYRNKANSVLTSIDVSYNWSVVR